VIFEERATSTVFGVRLFYRARLLGNDFPREIGAFVTALRTSHPDCRIEGAFALGEISSNGERFPKFHKKTIAASLFHAER
tara:strand:- start:115 stop:357 length:243 start_codon:yes stop_codon:yes gene_type:complete